jgi:tetratricopeptide (TPR) repeat protein
VDLLAIYPHAHYLGKRIEAWASLPGGERRWLIRIRDWDMNWQAVYEYKRPVALPRGSTIRMRITYDNSTANPRNPNRPPTRVRAGNRSEDEMGHVWLQVLPKESDSRLILQESVMRRRLEKYPGDFLAQYNLGALFQSKGQWNDAILAYRGALQTEPANATAHNSLAAALMMQGQVATAIGELRECLRLNPEYLNAHYNLAKALAANDDLNAAAKEYSIVLAKQPEDADAQAGLGTIEFKQRKYQDALARFHEAARLSPRNADIQTNLGTLLAITGDLPAAAAAFKQALRIDPNQEAARANLQKVQAKLAARH